MKYLDEYRDGDAPRTSWRRRSRGPSTRPWTIMEVCGGQTHTIVKYGIDQILPPGVELVHGPGCPVCVTSLEMIDRAHAIASRPDVIFCSFGDMLRVPGSRGDLLQLKSRGSDVRIVYSPLDAVNLAAANPDRKVVFFAIGFETTAPPNAMAVWLAQKRRLTNFSVLVSHVLVPPAIDGHPRSAGQPRAGVPRARATSARSWATTEYEPLAGRYRVPIVITGFEPVDLLEGILLDRPAARRRAAPRSRTLRPRRPAARGIPQSRRLIEDVFEVCDRKWRGIGTIPTSGYKLRAEYRDHDAERLFDVDDIETQESSRLHQRPDPQGAEEAARLPGVRQASARRRRPLGATMVSSEGACAAYYAYGRHLEANGDAESDVSR